tara:strand:- start:557 stop:709 length:153 start_codon:yes stop_codon:yes gene_type:complete
LGRNKDNCLTINSLSSSVGFVIAVKKGETDSTVKLSKPKLKNIVKKTKDN